MSDMSSLLLVGFLGALVGIKQDIGLDEPGS